MPKKPLCLDNGREFPTQGEATEYYRKILHSVTSKITKDSQFYSDLMALYKRHPEFKEKSENEENIIYFLVKESGEFKKKCFHTVHKDGSQTDWRLETAITGKLKLNFSCA